MKYVITHVHARREEKFIATGGDRRKRTETLLSFFRGSDRIKMCLVFCGASRYPFGNSSYSKSFPKTQHFSGSQSSQVWNFTIIEIFFLGLCIE